MDTLALEPEPRLTIEPDVDEDELDDDDPDVDELVDDVDVPDVVDVEELDVVVPEVVDPEVDVVVVTEVVWWLGVSWAATATSRPVAPSALAAVTTVAPRMRPIHESRILAARRRPLAGDLRCAMPTG